MAFPLKTARRLVLTARTRKTHAAHLPEKRKTDGHIGLWAGPAYTGFLNGAISAVCAAAAVQNRLPAFPFGHDRETEGRDVRVGKLRMRQATRRFQRLSGSPPTTTTTPDPSVASSGQGTARSGSGYLVRRATDPLPKDSVIFAPTRHPATGAASTGTWSPSRPSRCPFPASHPPRRDGAGRLGHGAPEVESFILPPWAPEEEFALAASADYQERKKALAAGLVEPAGAGSRVSAAPRWRSTPPAG